MATKVKPRSRRRVRKVVAEVLHEDIEPGQAAGLALGSFGLLDAAETHQGLAAGFFGGHAALDVFFDGELEVGGHFGFEFSVAGACGRKSGCACEIRGGIAHHVSPSAGIARTRPMTPDEALPIGGVVRRAAYGRPGDGVELGFAVVVGGAPLGGDPAALLEADERGIDGALVEQDLVSADLFDAAGDAVAVQSAHGVEGLQDHEVEGALEEVELGIGHRTAPVLIPHQYATEYVASPQEKLQTIGYA